MYLNKITIFPEYITYFYISKLNNENENRLNLQ